MLAEPVVSGAETQEPRFWNPSRARIEPATLGLKEPLVSFSGRPGVPPRDAVLNAKAP
jgi:hypothetical protein